MTEDPILWAPSAEQRQNSAMYRFMSTHGCADYDSLYQWSIDESAKFWESLTAFCQVEFDTPAVTTLCRPDDIMHAGWFDGARLSYAAHLLRHEGERAAIISYGEDGRRSDLSFDALRDAVASIAAGMRDAGVTEGDRVGGYLPNCPEAIIAMLATTSIGAIWSSCSPDFGANGVIDRFGQIEPKILFAANGYYYNGKRIDCRPTTADVVSRMPGILKTVVVDFADGLGTWPTPDNAIAWSDFARPGRELDIQAVAFDHPLFIMFSSGTTGVPKCIVHGHGGTLLQHLKEHVLHCDLGTDDRLFYFTTCGWMMWNWLVSALAAGPRSYCSTVRRLSMMGAGCGKWRNASG